ncbi:DNA-binding transcriptional regulator, MarR family [Roseateles sp. YR242]|uniref:MarR family winged helix-turn-helix transcriptional regulator n=1 Tax=Roseateles sp. YR242 TaxID=1855305 RepID=UPI0008B58617|nr:MarR family transcriptional regulator [Roseateles sp. YR242]SEK22822.1 DNA-binding transcriptional regulator, MarR family [Roseateles sp. YR242]
MTQDRAALDLPVVEKAGIRALHPLDGALLLMHFAFRGLVVQADQYLAKHGLSRVHHRILYVIARTDGISIGGLLEVLGITKQALHRPMKHLQDHGYVMAERDEHARRFKLLRLTAKGIKTERTASDHERAAMESALGGMSSSEQQAWRDVMSLLAARV